MCGIAGIVGARLSREDREHAARRMIVRQRHRGPDDEALVSSGASTIGMCRLAIFDPVNGRQPMTTPDGRFQIVFNGAIYNFRELRALLEPLGWKFQTECDTEVLLASFAQWGKACLPRLRGMFAFAVWDNVENVLFAARDPLGIKPLYYCRPAVDLFVFGSETNAILASGLFEADIDPLAVGDYLAWFAVPAPRTIYRNVANLPPGHGFTVDATGRSKVFSWWQLPESKPSEWYGSREDFNHALRAQLEDTIRAHRLADVPVGAFLSGGLDSSAVVGLMASAGVEKLKTFSLIFNETEYSEAEPARIVAQRFGTEHHSEILTGSQVAAEIETTLHRFDQPTGDGINTYFISRAARAGGVKVALSGLGGDEMFGGYPSFRDMPRLAGFVPFWRQMPRALREFVTVRLRACEARAQKLADFLEYARDLHELCSLRRRVLPETTRLLLLSPEARRLAERQGPNHPMLDDFVFELLHADPFQITSAWEMRTYMADVLLRDSDVFSMAHSLELRVPFVDENLVNWWWNKPRDLKFDRRRLKSALSDAVTDIVPGSIRNRPKQGFTLPFARWMRNELKPFLDYVFSPSSLAGCPWLDAKVAQRQWHKFHLDNDTRLWHRVWTLAVLIAFSNRTKPRI